MLGSSGKTRSWGKIQSGPTQTNLIAYQLSLILLTVMQWHKADEYNLPHEITFLLRTDSQVAEQYSEDKARQGGNLGWQTRGQMVKQQ